MQKRKEKSLWGKMTLETNKPPLNPRGEAQGESKAHTEEPRAARPAPQHCSGPALILLPALSMAAGLGLLLLWLPGPGLGDEGEV